MTCMGPAIDAVMRAAWQQCAVRKNVGWAGAGSHLSWTGTFGPLEVGGAGQDDGRPPLPTRLAEEGCQVGGALDVRLRGLAAAGYLQEGVRPREPTHMHPDVPILGNPV